MKEDYFKLVDVINGEGIFMSKEKYIEYLERLLEERLKTEEYEECCKIRDLINFHSS